MDEKTIRERAKAAVLGAFVADAASMSLHWIYAADAIGRLVEGGKEVAFFDPPSCPFYQAKLGALTPYGEEAMATLQSAAQHGGIDGPSLTNDLVAAFDNASGYVNSASKKLAASVHAGKGFPDASPDDEQAHSLVKMPIVVARYAGLPELADKVIEASRSHQKGEAAEQYALATARVLERVVLGDDISAAIQGSLSGAHPSVAAAFKAAAAAAAPDQAALTQVVQKFGPSCHLPGSFQGPLVAAQTSDSYASGVTRNILAGGDQASRAHVVGSLWAAQAGRSAIPEAWIAKTDCFAEVEALVDQLLKQRPP